MAYVGFSALKDRLSKEKGVSNPGAVAAAIGKRKYGAKKMSQASRYGKSHPNARPMLAPKRGM